MRRIIHLTLWYISVGFSVKIRYLVCIMYKMIFHFFLSISLGCLIPYGAIYAQSVTVLKELNFGEAVVTSNSAQYSIDVRSNGSFFGDSVFVFLTQPTEGIYRIEGLPVSTNVANVTIQVDQQMIGPGTDFIIDNFDIDAGETTNSSGELLINLGARLRTTGNGQNYLHNATFNSALTVTINLNI